MNLVSSDELKSRLAIILLKHAQSKEKLNIVSFHGKLLQALPAKIVVGIGPIA